MTYELTKADLVWNRACLLQKASSRNGDAALHSMLKAHGLVMNGGVLHCIELLSKTDELAESMEGYRYFGLGSVADLFLRAKTLHESETGNAEDILDRDYAKLVPADSALVKAFQVDFTKHPEAYEPTS